MPQTLLCTIPDCGSCLSASSQCGDGGKETGRRGIVQRRGKKGGNGEGEGLFVLGTKDCLWIDRTEMLHMGQVVIDKGKKENVMLG